MKIVLPLAGLIFALLLVLVLTNQDIVDHQPSNDELIRALMDRSGTAQRLNRELSSQPASADIASLRQRLQDNAREVDELGANWQDLDIIDLLEPAVDTSLEPLSQALAVIRHTEYVDHLVRARIEAASTIALLPTDARRAALLAVLREKREPRQLRQAVVEALSTSKDPAVIAALDLHWFSDPNRFKTQSVPPRGASVAMRRSRILALKHIHTAEADAALIAALQDPEPELRGVAAGALKGRTGYQVRDALIGLLDPTEAYVVVYKALWAIDGCPNEDFLLRVLQLFDEAPDLQELALSALGSCNDARVVAPIVDCLDQRQTRRGLRAANTLATLAAKRHDQIIAPLQESLRRDDIDPADREEIWRALERLLST